MVPHSEDHPHKCDKHLIDSAIGVDISVSDGGQSLESPVKTPVVGLYIAAINKIVLHHPCVIVKVVILRTHVPKA